MPRVATIHKIEQKNHRKNYGISFPRPRKTPYRVFFETEKERDRELKKALKQAAHDGAGVFSVTAADVQLLKDLRELLPADVDPREAVRFYMDAKGSTTDSSFYDARREYEHSLQLRKLSQDHREHVNRALMSLQTAVGETMVVSDIDSAQLTAFFSSLPFQPRTLANYQQYIRSFFGWCVKRGFCRRNPTDSIGRVKVPESEPEFMPVDDVKKLLKTFDSTQPDLVPYLALSFFAGFRSSSLQRLNRDDLKFDQQGILLPGGSHKTGRRFYVEGFEPCLWIWLERWRKLKSLPAVPKSTFIDRRRAAVKKAEVYFPHNAGRHSFCTYHIALKGNAQETASLLTHRGGISMLYNHYRGNTTKAEAQRFFKIRPA